MSLSPTIVRAMGSFEATSTDGAFEVGVLEFTPVLGARPWHARQSSHKLARALRPMGVKIAMIPPPLQ